MGKPVTKTIIYIGGFELPDKNAAAHRVVGNAKAFRELGYDVVFVDIDRTTKKNVLDTESSCYGFDRYSVPRNTMRRISIKNFKAIYNLYANSTIAVIAYNFPSIALFKLLMFCRRRRIKLYADCTEWYSYAGSHLIKHILGEIDTWLRMKVLHPKMDGMIAISKFLTDYYKDKLPTVCVPPLVDLADSKWCEIKTENKSVIQIVYAGSPGKNKDKLNYVIEALSQVNDIKFQFKIIGIDEKQYLEYYPEHQKLISELKDKVIFLGRLSHQRTLDHIKIADFSMFVRDVNRVTMAGFPTKFVESISCGTPVITNKTSDLDEYLEEGKNGFWLTHNIATSLNLIFKIDRENINRLKIDMDRSLFDYRGFVEQLRTILK